VSARSREALRAEFGSFDLERARFITSFDAAIK